MKPASSLKNSIVLIPGGSGGLGQALVSELGPIVGEIHLMGRERSALLAIQKSFSHYPIFIHTVDICTYADVEKVVKEIGSVDILINSAGIWLEGQLEEANPIDIAEVIDVNLKGAIYCVRATLPTMYKRRKGLILNIISTSGLYGRENHAVYAATKYGLRGFTESLQKDIHQKNIHVVGVYPGAMQTNIFKKAGIKRKTQGYINPAEVAKTIRFLIENRDTMIIDHIEINRLSK